YLKFEGKHRHYVTKRNEKAEKKKENEGLRITESTWRVDEGSHFAFCSSVLSAEGKVQVGGKREKSAHHREVPRSSTMSPNDPEHDDAEGWCKTTMNYAKGTFYFLALSLRGFWRLEGKEGFISKDLDSGLLDSSFLACNKT
ncbi:hypothetical protein MTR67_026148, partial [Solanum verrucosum]